jgi:hypothetical protein
MKLFVMQLSRTFCHSSAKLAFGYSDVKHLVQFTIPRDCPLLLPSGARFVEMNIYKMAIWKNDVIDPGILCISLILHLL